MQLTLLNHLRKNLWFFTLFIGTISFAAPTLNLSSTPANCPGATGTITANVNFDGATPDNGTVTYHFVSVPSGTTAPNDVSTAQNPYTFATQVNAGTYTIEARYYVGGVLTTLTQTITVTNSYSPLGDITTSSYRNSCDQVNGFIKVAAISGRSPYTIEIYQGANPPASGTTPLNTYTNIASLANYTLPDEYAAGSYFIRVIDACGVVKVNSVTVTPKPNYAVTAIGIAYGQIHSDCDYVYPQVYASFADYATAAFPVNVYFEVVDNSVSPATTTVLGPYTASSGFNWLQTLLPIPINKNLTIRAYTSCDPTVKKELTNLNFNTRKATLWAERGYSCVNNQLSTSTTFYINFEFVNQTTGTYFYDRPFSIYVKEVGTNTVVGQIVNSTSFGNQTITINDLPCDKTYYAEVVSCGVTTVTNQYTITCGTPVINPMVILQRDCIEGYSWVKINPGSSVAGETLTYTLTSGPTVAGVTYPMNFTSDGMKHLPVGDYTFSISSTCRPTATGGFTVRPQDLANFAHTWTESRTCAANSTQLVLNFPNRLYTPYSSIEITNSAGITNTVNYSNSNITGSTTTFSGFQSNVTYTIKLKIDYFANLALSGATSFQNLGTCPDILDTYTFNATNTGPKLDGSSAVKCPGGTTTNVVANATGVGPFEYRLLDNNNVVVRDWQTSNTFTNLPDGTYKIEAKDACTLVNVYTTSTSLFAPEITVGGTPCSGQNVVLNATEYPGATYSWVAPGSTAVVSTSSSHTIFNYTSANDGTYKVTVNYAGCTVEKEIVFTNCRTLPVTFEKFNVTEKNCKANVTWTAHESQMAAYEIQISKDGNIYQTVTSLPAVKGVTNNYSATVPMVKGNNYFRIKAIDTNGDITYSSIAKLNNSCDLLVVTATPNPAGNYTTLYGLPAGGKITVFNQNGQVVYKTSVRSEIQTLQVRQWVAGTYNVVVTDAAGNKSSTKIVKSN